MSDSPLGSVDRPLVVGVVGSSVSYMVVPRVDVDDRSYGELLPVLLADEDVRARVHLSSRWFGLVHQLNGRWERLRDTMPDVLVVNFGMGEAQARVVPTLVMEHLTTWRRSSHPVALAYRRHVADRAWAQLRELQRRLGPRLEDSYRLSPERFAVEVQQLARRARTELGALVLFLDLDPVGSRVLHWLPDQDRRAARMNHALHDAVTALDDPLVRVVRASATVASNEVDQVLPDGFHRNAEGHRRTARLLADELVTWLDGRP